MIFQHLQKVNVVFRVEDLPELCVPALQLQYLLLQTVHVALSLRHRRLHVGHYHLIDFSLPALHRLQHFVECLITFRLSSLGTTLKGQISLWRGFRKWAGCEKSFFEFYT